MIWNDAALSDWATPIAALQLGDATTTNRDRPVPVLTGLKFHNTNTQSNEPPGLGLELNQALFHPGDTMVLTATLTPGTAPALVDAYVVIQLPDGTFLSLRPVGAVPGIAPFATGFTPPPFSGTIFSYQFTGAEPPGLYSWFAALTQAGTLNVVGSIDQDSFTFSPSGHVAVFTDPATGFSTSDVRDVQEQIVRFDVASNSLIWAADGRSFSGYPVSGNFIRADRFFQVRFGTKDGQRRAYFTETVATTICDVEIVGGQLVILPTNVTVPES